MHKETPKAERFNQLSKKINTEVKQTQQIENYYRLRRNIQLIQ